MHRGLFLQPSLERAGYNRVQIICVAVRTVFGNRFCGWFGGAGTRRAVGGNPVYRALDLGHGRDYTRNAAPSADDLTMGRWGSKRDGGRPWTQERLDASLGAMYGKRADVVDTDPRTNANHARWKTREAANSSAKLYPLVGLCVGAGVPSPRPEFEFHPVRKWRFDYAWPDEKIAVEIEGGIWREGGGAHSHPLNIERDIDKYNAAAVLGWRILRVAPENMLNVLPMLQTMFGLIK